MPSTTPYRRGDIVLVAFPFTDLSSLKKRPALVVSPDAFNEAGADLVLAAITSQISEDMTLIIVLRKVCELRPEKLDMVLADLRQFFSAPTDPPAA